MSDYQPRPGDIGLTSIAGEVGRLIGFGQWLNAIDLNPRTWFDDTAYRYEHAFVVVDNGFPGNAEPYNLIVEAEPGGARLATRDQYAGRRVVYLRCPDEHRDAVAAAARGLLRTPYSFLDYVSLAARRLRVPAPHLRAYIRDSGHQICSQLADEAARRGGWHIFVDHRWPGDVTPGDLYREALKQQSRSAV